MRRRAFATWVDDVLVVLFVLYCAASVILSCATGTTLAPLPPLPGPNINDWARAADGGGQ